MNFLKTSTLLLLLLTIIASKCKEDTCEIAPCCDPIHVTTMDSDELDYIRVNEGSYWVFEDSASKETETLTLCKVKTWLASQDPCYSYDSRANYYEASPIFGGRYYVDFQYAFIKEYNDLSKGDSTQYNYFLERDDQCEYQDILTGTIHINSQMPIYLYEEHASFEGEFLSLKNVRKQALLGDNATNSSQPGIVVYHSKNIGLIRIEVLGKVWNLKSYHLE